MEWDYTVLVVVIFLQFVLLYIMQRRTRFKLNDVKTSNDMQVYLQTLDSKFEEKYNDIDQIISNLDQQVISYGKEAKKHISDVAKSIEHTLYANQKILDGESAKVSSSIDQINRQLSLFDDSIEKIQSQIPDLLDSTEKKLSLTLNEEFSPIKNHIVKDFEKLKRYENEYDQKITKRYNNEIFRILDYIKKQRKINDSEALEDIEEDILIMLKNSGIERHEYFVGDTVKQEDDQYLLIDYIETDDEDKEGKIIEVKKHGYFSYFLNKQDKKVKKSIKEAKVAVYKFEQQGEK